MKVINIETKKFKSNAISIVIPLSLDEKVTDYNLITSIIKRGCFKYPSAKEIWQHLEELYGAIFEIIITKKGEKLLLNFYIQFIDNKYVLYDEDIIKDSVEFLNEIINHTLINNDEFKQEYFIQEKENLKVLINSRIDNKDEYVIERAAELCCEGEPYAIYQYGDIERLNNIENRQLTVLWLNTIKNSEFYIIACGNINKENLENLTKKYFLFDAGNKIEENIRTLENYNFKEKFEKFRINQGKLCLCFRTNINIKEGDYFALSVMNSILGGGTHGKLFKEVREKNSLAYYIYSFIEKYKGLLLITAGIDFNNYERVKEIILEQIEKIKTGDISDLEIENSKKKLINDLKSASDSLLGIIDYIGALRVYGALDNISDVICGIEKVSKERIIKSFEKLILGSSYFLQNE